MDFSFSDQRSKSLSHILAHILSSLILVARNFLFLIISPYKTMRRIAKETDFGQLVIIFCLAVAYFYYAQTVRQRAFHPLLASPSIAASLGMFGVTFILITKFFYYVSQRMSIMDGADEHAKGNKTYKANKTNVSIQYKPFVFTFAYSLLPTFIWFYATSTLYYLLPPPRTTSFLGKGFSMVFIVFSVSLLLWRIVLLYLSIRFSTKASFYRIALSMALFTLWFLPYCYAMYKLEIFRIPFI